MTKKYILTSLYEGWEGRINILFTRKKAKNIEILYLPLKTKIFGEKNVADARFLQAMKNIC